MNSWLFPPDISFADSIYGSLSICLHTIAEAELLQNLFFFVLILFQAYLFNGFINFFKLSKSPSYISAVCYILLHFIGLDVDVANPLLLANTFLLMAIYSLFASHNKKASMTTVFNIGFFIGLAVLCYHSHIVYLYWSLCAFVVVRSFDFKEFMILISGFMVPLILMGTYQYLQNNLATWLQDDFFRHYGPSQFNFDFGLQWNIMVGCTIFIYILAVLNLKNIFLKTAAKEKKFISCLYIMPIFSLLTFCCQVDLYPFHYATFIIAISALLSLSLQSFKNQLAVESIHFVLFMICLGVQYQDLFFG